MSEFDRFCDLLLREPELLSRLRGQPTLEALFEAVCAAARARGIELTPAALQAVVQANQRAWIERWLA